MGRFFCLKDGQGKAGVGQWPLRWRGRTRSSSSPWRHNAPQNDSTWQRYLDEWVKDELAKAESNIWEAPDTATAEPSPPNEAENTFDKSHSEFQPITTTLPILQDPFETLKDEDKIPVTNSNDNINTNRQSSYLPPLNASPPRPQRFSTTNVAKNDENDDTNNGNDTKPQETATTHEGEQSKRSYVDEALNNPFLGN
eukprot:c12152_g1_i3.p1 GENE.c12152_g1_i3~~c12152_g1_i3.p1  ORF type:complete len:197 (+),score=38.15 c12152_g1_i3:1-591(+)